mgnify:CR=1 FL=1
MRNEESYKSVVERKRKSIIMLILILIIEMLECIIMMENQ